MAMCRAVTTGAMLVTTQVMAAAPARLEVPAAAIEVAGVEYWVEAFRIDAKATATDEAPSGCQAARGEEWLAAAKLGELVPSQAFEQLAAPPDEPCSFSREVLEAEGIEGWMHFAGLGAHKGSATEVVTGGTSARTTWVRVHSNPYSFWGDEYKPAPRAHRCVERKPGPREQAFVQASRLKLRPRRASAGDPVADLPIATEVAVVHREGDWAFVEVKSKGEVSDCVKRGWVGVKFIGADKPDADRLLAEGKHLLEAGDGAGAVPRLERAAALRPTDRMVLEALLAGYTKAGMKADADDLARHLARGDGKGR
jgi:hypothetical protein